jgi:hypothetical protein
MSNTSDSSLGGDDLVDARHDDLGRDVEVLLKRLSETREAIARLLAAESHANESVEEEASAGNASQYAEPRPLTPLRPLPSSLRRPGPPALELALIYRHMAENDAGALHEAQPDAAVGEPPATGPKMAARAPWGHSEGAGASSNLAGTDGPGAARRRLLAVVLVAVGSVVLLTTIVSLLPTLANLL